MDMLSLKYRPSSFAEMVGQKITSTVLSQMVAKAAVPTGLLFSGVRGSGKTSAARILQASFGSIEGLEIDAASNGSVADVRLLIESLRYGTGTHKVVIIDEAHSMSKEAFNALLKTLEEPPAGTIFVLVTTEPDKLPDTVKSRLMEFVFTKVSAAEIFDRLVYVVRQEKIEIEEGLLILLAERADGGVRNALMSLDQVWRADIHDVASFLEMSGDVDNSPALVSALMDGDHADIFRVVEKLLTVTTDPTKIASQLISCLRDLLILRSGGVLPLSASEVELRKDLALRLDPARILSALVLLWDLKTRVRASSDAKSNLDLALILVSETFTRGREQPVVKKETTRVSPPKVEAPVRLSLADLA